MQVVICPVRHETKELNGPYDCYSGPIESPFQARQVKCRAIHPDRNVLMDYETSLYCSDADLPQERACMSRMVSQMYI